MSEKDKCKFVTFMYKNHRGVEERRVVRPINMYFGCTDYYPDMQYLIQAHDQNRGAIRTFAMSEIKDWQPLNED